MFLDQSKILKKFTILLNFAIQLYIYNAVNIYCLEPPKVNVPGQGIIVGTYVKMFRVQNIKAYLGIKYAHAVRFSPPEVDATKWHGVWNATSFAPNCWQAASKSSAHEMELVVRKLLKNKIEEEPRDEYNENCLYLNIFVPDGSPGDKGYAVIIWIHGGDFSYGSPKDIEPFQLVFKQKVIVVTFSYRLNIFGFLSTGDGEAQGNYGLMDQSAAIFWIRKNINNFGGDENKITIMGHSAGSISVGLHLLSEEWSKKGFSRAIMMSGNILTENVVRAPSEYHDVLDTIANIFGCIRRPTSMLISCLKKVDARTMSVNIPIVEWGPVIDHGLSNTSSHFIRDKPSVLFKNGSFQKVPIIIGVTDMEDISYLFEETMNKNLTNNDLDTLISDISDNDMKTNHITDESCINFKIVSDAINYIYRSQSSENNAKQFIHLHTDKTYIAPLYLLADILSRYNSVFAYLFTIRPKTDFYSLPDWVQVPKLFDQIFVWGVPYMNNSNIVNEWSPDDKQISDAIMTMWANFAKSANPTISNIYVKWNSYTDKNKSLLVIDENFNSVILNNFHVVEFWNNFYPKIITFALNCCNMTNAAEVTSTRYLAHLISGRVLIIHIGISIIYYAFSSL